MATIFGLWIVVCLSACPLLARPLEEETALESRGLGLVRGPLFVVPPPRSGRFNSECFFTPVNCHEIARRKIVVGLEVPEAGGRQGLDQIELDIGLAKEGR